MDFTVFRTIIGFGEWYIVFTEQKCNSTTRLYHTPTCLFIRFYAYFILPILLVI